MGVPHDFYVIFFQYIFQYFQYYISFSIFLLRQWKLFMIFKNKWVAHLSKTTNRQRTNAQIRYFIRHEGKFFVKCLRYHQDMESNSLQRQDSSIIFLMDLCFV